MLLSSIIYDQMKEKLSNRLAAAIVRDFRLENIEWSKFQVIFVTEEEIFSKPFLSCLKKTASLFHSSALHVFFFVGRQSIRFLFQLILFGYLLVSENALKRN